LEIYESARPLGAVLIPLGAVILIGLSGKKPNLRESWTILAALVKFCVVASMLPLILQGKTVEYLFLTVLPGLEIKFRVDALGIIFALTASFLWIVTSFYSIGYMRSLDEHAQTRYYMCFAVALASAVGIAFSANLFTLFAFYEILTLCTYPLVVHKQTPEAIKGARKYLVFLLGTSIFFQLPAIILTYFFTGTLEFSNHGIFAGKAPDFVVIIVFTLFIAGIAKAPMMPWHSWLPAAMVAPTPVSALLHAVAVVKAGVFTVVRVVLYVFGVDLLRELGLGVCLAYFASFTIIVASIMALRQDNLKLRLAYSTVSQLSYIILAVALLTPGGISGSLMHITIHAFGKITLFFTAGAIYVATQKTNVSELDGVGKQMPFTMAAFAVGALSMVGVPPLGGFISKWFLLWGAIEAHQLLIIAVMVASTLLNAGYYLPIVYAAFFKEPLLGKKIQFNEAPALMVVPLVITALGVLLLFFGSSFIIDLAGTTVVSVLGGDWR
jgi:multicomponent Na+:H+ antiporter subunit D